MSNFRNRVSLAERRYNNVSWTIRKNIRDIGLLDQYDLAYLQKEVQDYGWEFFSNHYTMDAIEKMKEILEKNKIKVDYWR